MIKKELYIPKINSDNENIQENLLNNYNNFIYICNFKNVLLISNNKIVLKLDTLGILTKQFLSKP